MVYAEGVGVKKGSRRVILPSRLLESNENEPTEVDIKKEINEQEQLQEESKEFISQLQNETLKNNNKEIEVCQEYLKEVKIEVF